MPKLTVCRGSKRNRKEEEVLFGDEDTVREIKQKLLDRYDGSRATAVMAQQYNCVALKLSFPDKTELRLNDLGLTVHDITSLKSYEGAKLEYKFVGAQINYRLVFILEYLGPVLIMLLFSLQPAFLYNKITTVTTLDPVAVIGIRLWLLHFIKRELETLFVHKFSRETMPLTNLFKNSAHYWFAAIYVGFPLCSPTYEPPAWTKTNDSSLSYILIPGWFACQFVNFAAHLYFSNVRQKDGDTRRPMPTGPLFYLVSCPNYTAEVLGWMIFSFYTGLWSAWFFTFAGYYQIQIWGLQKHRRYKKEYGDAFKTRASVVPLLL